MATNTAGDVGQEYHTNQTHYISKSVLYTDAGRAVTIGTIPAGAVLLYAISGAYVTTAFTGSGTDLLDIGTTDNDDAYATDLDVSSLGLKAFDETAASAKLTSATTFTATYADQNSNAGAGEAVVTIFYIMPNR
jgi:hypothetical protein